MRSPGSRRGLELGCRAVACVALGALLWRAWSPAPRTDPALAVAGARELGPALADGVHRPVAALDLTLDSLPGPRERDWARALAAAGTAVRWRLAARGGSPADSAGADDAWQASLTAEPLADPSGRVRVVARAPAGATLRLGDATGSIDSSTIGPSGVRVLDLTSDGGIAAGLAGVAARTAPRERVVLRPVLVLAEAGWEGKFVVAALEEAGWRVDARFRVTPQLSVRQGGGAIDTARYAAVIALDGSASTEGAAIARFVRSGGGAILTARAASIPALAAVAPARVGAPTDAALGAVASDVPRRGLGGHALVALRATAVPLERVDGAVRIAAARVDLGRVLLLGYDETWRWRMEGGDGSPEAHRAWWSAMVASVARAPLEAVGDPAAVDETPYAALVAALGAPTDASPPGGPARGDTARDALLLALLLGALLAEWTSRRLRGAR